MSNDDQVAYWNGPVGDKWAKYQDRIDASLAPLAHAVIAFAKPAPGESVLDIGCGTGALSELMEAAVGEDGMVTGLDISDPMLQTARQRVPDARFILADATDYGFGPVYDLVTSRLGVMFFDAPATAFANLRKALKPDGRLAFICWRGPQENEWVSRPFAAAKPHIPPQPTFDPTGPGQFSLADPDHTRGLLEKAGFHDIRIEKFDGRMTMGRDLDEAVNYATRLIGPTSRAMKDLDAGAREAVTNAVRETLSPLAEPDGVKAGIACWLVYAKP